MLLGDITVEQLNAINNKAAFEDRAGIRELCEKLLRTHYGYRLNESELSGLAVGIKIGLILAESDQLERILGEKE